MLTQFSSVVKQIALQNSEALEDLENNNAERKQRQHDVSENPLTSATHTDLTRHKMKYDLPRLVRLTWASKRSRPDGQTALTLTCFAGSDRKLRFYRKGVLLLVHHVKILEVPYCTMLLLAARKSLSSLCLMLEHILRVRVPLDRLRSHSCNVECMEASQILNWKGRLCRTLVKA